VQRTKHAGIVAVTMPELPEVETTRRGIAPYATGRTIRGVKIYDRRLRWPVPADLPARAAGRRIDRVDRRSKYLLLRVSGDTLLIHLGMTGSLRVHHTAPERVPHDHVDIELDSGTVLRYHDPRRFGAVLWLEGTGDAHPLLSSLGPEPLEEAFNAAALWRATRRRGAAIKLALMDNHLVVGVGNIYANEALFRAGIRPTIAARRLTKPRLERLVAAVRATLADAIAKGGSTLRDYVDSEGNPGYFQLDYFVYGREGQPCRVCGAVLRSLRQGGRATTFCPVCQK
jgi:formamidopyrimidine-DNA glycosylase